MSNYYVPPKAPLSISQLARDSKGIILFTAGFRLPILKQAIICSLLGLVFLFSNSNTFAQSRTVSGKVTAQEDGSNVPGVNITVKGSTTGTVTDGNGSYSLAVPDNSTLVFSYIGYTTEEVIVGNQSTINVQLLPDVKTLTEVVVIGYGTQEKKDVTGSISSVSGEQLARIPTATLANALQGQAAGVQVTANTGAPGGGFNIRIRGTGTINNNDVLYVVDGVQQSGNINYLNSADIESMQVLKDASASAIYGSRAANGVVIITTKRGKAGKGALTLNAYYGVQQPWRKLDMTNAAEYVTLDNLARGAAGVATNPAWVDPASVGEGTNYQDELFRTAPIQDYQLGWSGGNERSTFYVSGGYFRSDGIVIASDFERYTFRINSDHKATDKLKVGNSLLVSATNSSLTTNNTGFNTGVLERGIRQLPTIPVRNPDGTYAGPNTNFEGESENPVWLAEQAFNKDRNYRAQGSIYGDYEIIPGLSFRSTFNLNFNYFDRSDFNPAFAIGNRRNDVSSLSNTSGNFREWQWSNVLTYQKVFGNHNLTALAGIEAQDFNYKEMSAARANFLKNEQIQYLNQGTEADQARGFANSASIYSQFGRVNYDFNNKYLVTATIRRDGSSKFANNRYGIFPSGSLGWRISEEGFFEAVPLVSNLMLRGSWGITGNQASVNTNYPTFGVINPNANYAFGGALSAGFSQNDQINPDIKWESTTQTNFGFDAGLLENRISLTVDYFVRTTNDMILQLPIPRSTGANAGFTNAGSLENRGFEVAVGYRKSEGEFTYGINVNATRIRNKVLDLRGQIINTEFTRTQEGLPISQYYGYVVDGIFRNEGELVSAAKQTAGTNLGDIRYRDLNNDGSITDEDRAFIGNPLPDLTAGLNGDLAYRGFDLNFTFNSSFGNDLMNQISRFGYSSDPGNKFRKLIGNTWTPENPNAEYPRLVTGDPGDNGRAQSSRWVVNGTYVRLKNIQLGYTLPKALTERAKLSQVRVYIQSANLFTLTNYEDGFDPEQGTATGNALEIGIDRGVYPQPRTFILGLNIGL